MTREQAALVAEALRLLAKAVELEHAEGRDRDRQDPDRDQQDAEAEAALRKAGLI